MTPNPGTLSDSDTNAEIASIGDAIDNAEQPSSDKGITARIERCSRRFLPSDGEVLVVLAGWVALHYILSHISSQACATSRLGVC